MVLYTAIKKALSFRHHLFTCCEHNSFLKILLGRLEVIQDIRTTNNLCWKLPFLNSHFVYKGDVIFSRQTSLVVITYKEGGGLM